MQYFIYSIVIFLSTLLGAFVGLGGGVIIKPMLDVLHMHTLSEIAFFSSCAVLAMFLAVSTVGGYRERRAVCGFVRTAFVRARFCESAHKNGEASKSRWDSVCGLAARYCGGIFGHRRRTDQCGGADTAVFLLRKGCGSLLYCAAHF